MPDSLCNPNASGTKCMKASDNKTPMAKLLKASNNNFLPLSLLLNLPIIIHANIEVAQITIIDIAPNKYSNKNFNY